MKPFAYVTRSKGLVRANVLEAYALKAAGDGEQSKQILDPFDQLYGQHNLAQPPYPPLALARLLTQNAYHARACKVKARDAAGLGWSLTSTVEDPDEAQHDRAMERIEAFRAPLQTTLTMGQLDYEAIGWGALELIRERGSFDGEVVDVVHLPAHELRIRRFRQRGPAERGLPGEAFAQVVGTKTVWFRPAGAAYEINAQTGERARAGSLHWRQRGNEIVYWRNYTPAAGRYYGTPDILPALGAVLGDATRRDYNIAFFRNHGVPSWAVFVTGDFDAGPEDEEGKTELERALEEKLDEIAENPGSVFTLMLPTREGEREGKVEVRFEKLSAEVKEASFQLYRKDNRDEVLAAHGVDPYRLGIAETGSLSGTTAQEATKTYKASIVEPRQFDLETLFARHVMATYEAPDYAWKLADIDTADEKHDLDMLARLVEIRAVWPREVRRHFASRFDLDAEADIPDEVLPDLASIDAGLKTMADWLRDAARRPTGNGNGDGGLSDEDMDRLVASVGRS